MKLRLSQKGWIVIPAALRKKYNLKAGDFVQIVDYGGVFGIVPIDPDPIRTGAGLLRGEDSLTTAVIEEHRKERQRDEASHRSG